MDKKLVPKSDVMFMPGVMYPYVSKKKLDEHRYI